VGSIRDLVLASPRRESPSLSLSPAIRKLQRSSLAPASPASPAARRVCFDELVWDIAHH
jgi:hypothetical protein